MTITIEHVCAGLVGVPCIIALAKAGDHGSRMVAALALLLAVAAVVGPQLAPYLFGVDTARLVWAACGIVAIIAGVRVADGALSSLIITGGAMGALLELGVIAGH